MSLQNIIETAFEQRAEITPHNVSAEVKEAVLDTIYQLDSGSLRVAERQGVGQWKVNEWAKKAVLLSFRIADNEVSSDGVSKYFDKVPTKFADWIPHQFQVAGFRRARRRGAPRQLYRQKRGADALLCEHRRLCGRGHDGGHLGHCGLLRANR